MTMHVEPLRNGKLTRFADGARFPLPYFHSPNSSFPHSLHPQSPFRLFKFHLESGGGGAHLNGYAFILGGGHFKNCLKMVLKMVLRVLCVHKPAQCSGP